MDEQAILASMQRVLAEYYGQSECTFHSLNTRSLDDASIVYKMYRVDLNDHTSWVISATHDQIIDSHTFRWELQGTATTWLEARARLLIALTRQRYPAPEIILALSGACVVKSGTWSVLVTSWITGPNSQFQPEPLAQAGALLARLHMLPLEAMPFQPARWNSSYSIPMLLRNWSVWHHTSFSLTRHSTRSAIPPCAQFYVCCLRSLKCSFMEIVGCKMPL